MYGVLPGFISVPVSTQYAKRNIVCVSNECYIFHLQLLSDN